MQFSSFLAAAAALAVANALNFTMTASQFVSVPAGQPFDFSWTGASGTVTLLLKDGAADDLQTVTTIATGLTGTTYTWTPPETIPAGAYAFEITDSDGESNYSQFFTLASNTVASTSVSASTSGTSTTASTISSTSSLGTSTSSGSLTTSVSTSVASSATAATNSTSTGSASKTSSTTTGSTTSGTSTTTPSSVSSASGFSSPLAFVLLAFAAMVTLN